MSIRMTRKKAAELAESVHIDENVSQENEKDSAQEKVLMTPAPGDRPALGELAPNSADSKSADEGNGQELQKSTRGKKGTKKGGKKAKKADPAAIAAVDEEAQEEAPEDAVDDNESMSSPASEEAAEEHFRGGSQDADQIDVEDARPPSPPSAAVESLRIGSLENAKAAQSPTQAGGAEQKSVQEYFGRNDKPSIEMTEPVEGDAHSEAMTTLPIDAPASPLPSATAKAVQSLRTDTPGKRSTSNKENVEPEEAEEPAAAPSPMPEAPEVSELSETAEATTAPVLEQPSLPDVTSPTSAQRPSSSRSEDAIEAMDDLDEAVETVTKDIKDAPRSPPKQEDAKQAPAKDTKPAKKEPWKKPAPVVRTTKASQARISMMQGGAGATNAPSGPQTTLNRTSSVRQSTSTSTQPPAPSRRATSNPTAKPFTKPAAKPTTKSTTSTSPKTTKPPATIPHSKPRPVTLSFPTPPPPARSTKAPTQSTFALPGEAVAAKLKAAREARANKDSETTEPKREAFKARPAPAVKRGGPPEVRATNSSRGRESVGGVGAGGLKRANTTAGTTKPAAPSASKRVSSITSAMGAGASKHARAASATTAPAAKSVAAKPPRPSSMAVKPTAPAATAKPKALPAAAEPKFDRGAAAKKARAEAAERSRVLSREWAEKKKGGKKTVAPKAEEGLNTEEKVAGSSTESASEKIEKISEVKCEVAEEGSSQSVVKEPESEVASGEGEGEAIGMQDVMMA